MEDSPFSLFLWCRSVGLMPFERVTAEGYLLGLNGIMYEAPNLDVLVPPYESSERTSPIVVATFNLVATIVGGGVLSLPLAFEKCGIILATVLMIFSAFITDRSLYLLCLCARQAGVNTYGEVGKIAFGPWMEWCISGLLFVFLLFVLVAYMVLIRDIWTGLLHVIIPHARPNLVLLGSLVLMSPFLVQRSLYALRYNCYAGFLSISILCIALCHHASQKVVSDEPVEVRVEPSTFGNALFAFPIITLSFLSIFNILPIQSALIQPSKHRMRLVINRAVGACFALMYLFGLAGYLFAGSSTQGNILLNLNQTNDVLVLLGRIGCGTTILLATAMMLLPCRQSFLEVVETLIVRPPDSCQETCQKDACDEEDQETCTTLLTRSSADRSTDLYVPTETTQLLAPIEESSPPIDIYSSNLAHYGSTFLIVLVCYLGAVAASGVAVVWSICGSTMAFLIAFILPTACFIRIQKRLPRNHETQVWLIFSWLLLILSVVATIACSSQAVASLFATSTSHT